MDYHTKLFVIFLISLISSTQSQSISQNDIVVLLRCALDGASLTPWNCFNASVVFTYVLSTVQADCTDLIFKGKCQSTVAVYEKGRYVFLQFKGETGVANFASNVASIMSTQTLQQYETYGKVGQDTLTAFNRLWYDGGFGKAINDTWNKYCDFNIYISGHGLGGCLSQMAAIKISELWPKARIQTYTYGSPRCGNPDFAALHDSNIGFSQRVMWYKDPVGQYPPTNPSLCDYTKSAADNIGKDCWFHAMNTVRMKTFALYGTVYTYDYCTLGENKTCLTGNTPADHYAYANTVASQYDSLSCGSTNPYSYIVLPAPP